jgi:hypothetical protein
LARKPPAKTCRNRTVQATAKRRRRYSAACRCCRYFAGTSRLNSRAAL